MNYGELLRDVMDRHEGTLKATRRTTPQRGRVSEIIEAAAFTFDVTPETIFSASHRHDDALARSGVCNALVRLGYTHTEVGYFVGRAPSTVGRSLHRYHLAIKKGDTRMRYLSIILRKLLYG